MNQQPDRLFVDWLGEGAERGPEHGLERALAATRRTNQRPGWTFASKWLPTPLVARRAATQRSFAILIAVALLAVALAAAVLLVGAVRRAAPPFGLASNGAILLDVDGRLWQANADGSNPREFVAENLGLAYSPVHSPDGTRIAYLTQAGGLEPMSIFVANADGSGAHNVTGDMKVIAGPLDAPAWSPDGSTLVFTSSDVKGNPHLYTVGADGANLTALAEAGEATRRYPAWSPDGQWLAYQLLPLDATGDAKLAISRPDGSGERFVHSVHEREVATFAAPQWSPDSKRLAYFTAGTPGGVVGVVDLDGKSTILSGGGEDAFAPLWSPDGHQLFYSHDLVGATVVDVDEPSKRVEIPAGLANCGAVWAPDATAILGLGNDCTQLLRIPLADPMSATPIKVPAGSINLASWQRLAP